jgi:eukaryotic-like serine/threonine-protein kinase
VSPAVATSLLATTAAAVEQIHQAGILHLDLKPSNILIDSDRAVLLNQVTPKVGDFGIARARWNEEPAAAETGTTLDGPWGGTPSYMAPEQITGTRMQLGPPADVHALGAILYELITGRPPFQGDSILHTLNMVREKEPVPPRQINPRISRDLETITLRCLQKDPSQRYPSAQALADDLRLCLNGQPIRACRVSGLERAWRWCRHRPAIAGLIGTLALTFGCTFLAIFLLWTKAAAARARSEKNLDVASIAIESLATLVTNALDGSQQQVRTSIYNRPTRLIFPSNICGSRFKANERAIPP